MSRPVLYQLPGYGFPGFHAESYQTARMSAGFLENGVDARVVFPSRSAGIPWSEVQGEYGLAAPLHPVALPGASLEGRSRVRRRVASAVQAAVVGGFGLRAGAQDVFLGRHAHFQPMAALVRLKAARALRPRIFLEVHEASHYRPESADQVAGFIVLSDALARVLREAGVPSDRILVAPNAVDLDAYERVRGEDRGALRAELGLEECARVVCYTGQLGPGRNVEALVSAVAGLPAEVRLVVVGGRNPDDVERIRAFAAEQGVLSRLRLVGQQNAEVVRRFQVAADALVVPYASYLAHAAWCSPLKLWEYLAAGPRIVAFPLPAFRSVVSDGDVVWADEESPRGLAAAITAALSQPRRDDRALKAGLEGRSWRARAQRVADFMGILNA